MHRRLRPVALAVLLVVAGCGGRSTGTPAGGAAPDTSAATGAVAAPSRLLDPAAFAAAAAEPGRVLIDVHVPFEGKLAGTDLMIPFDQIAARVADLPADRSTPLAIYCRSGNMSAIAAPTLATLGFRNIVELRGGMDAWVAQGRVLLHTP